MTDTSQTSAEGPIEPPLPPRPARKRRLLRPAAPQLNGFILLLFAVAMWGWGTSWYALKLQSETTLSLEWAVALRFALSALIMALWTFSRGESLIVPVRKHAYFLPLGMALFSTNFLFYMYAAQHLVSGLLAVMFAMASVVSLGLGALFLKQRVTLRMVFGAFVGIAGVTAMFWPEIFGADAESVGILPIILCCCGTLSFCSGSIISGKLQAEKTSVYVSTTWGMIYGAIWMTCLAIFQGAGFEMDMRFEFLFSFIWLVVFSSILAFWAYLNLVGRLGAGRAGYVTVLFPLVALTISTVIENYHWTILAIGGAALVMIGNWLVLGAKK